MPNTIESAVPATRAIMAQRIMIARQGNIQGKKQLAKDIAGIVD